MIVAKPLTLRLGITLLVFLHEGSIRDNARDEDIFIMMWRTVRRTGMMQRTLDARFSRNNIKRLARDFPSAAPGSIGDCIT
jgi:hypothetical protein